MVSIPTVSSQTHYSQLFSLLNFSIESIFLSFEWTALPKSTQGIRDCHLYPLPAYHQENTESVNIPVLLLPPIPNYFHC